MNNINVYLNNIKDHKPDDMDIKKREILNKMKEKLNYDIINKIKLETNPL